MDLNKLERVVALGSRYLTLIAVIGSLGGSILMFFIGFYNILRAFHYWMPSADSANALIADEAASVIGVIEGLDRFLIAIVLLYFAYGVYSLFIQPERRETELSLPQWLRVKQVGQLKQVVAEVIIVVLFVLFLRVSLHTFQSPDLSLTWLEIATFLLLPLSTVMLALSLRLVELHPKPSSLDKLRSGEDKPESGSADR